MGALSLAAGSPIFPVWISTLLNPADEPSRVDRRPPHPDLRAGYDLADRVPPRVVAEPPPGFDRPAVCLLIGADVPSLNSLRAAWKQEEARSGKAWEVISLEYSDHPETGVAGQAGHGVVAQLLSSQQLLAVVFCPGPSPLRQPSISPPAEGTRDTVLPVSLQICSRVASAGGNFVLIHRNREAWRGGLWSSQLVRRWLQKHHA